MKNKIIDFLEQKILNKTPTTKGFVYKEKIINVNDIDGSYKKLVETSDEWEESKLKFGNQSIYWNRKSFDEASVYHNALSNYLAKNEDLNKIIHKIKLSEIFNSLWIEGMRSSKKTIKQFLKEKPYTEADFEGKIIRNYDKAIDYIFSTQEINEINLLGLYITLTKDIDMKENSLDGFPYREGDVTIGQEVNGKYIDEGINPTLIKQSMDYIFEKINQIEVQEDVNKSLAIVLSIHYLFELIHPYYDMNGRMGRLLSIWVAKQIGVGPHLFFLSEAINHTKQAFYYDAFSKSKFQNFKYDATYFINSLICSLTLEKFSYLVIKEHENVLKSKFKKSFTEIEKTILSSLLSKDHTFFKAQDIILGIEQYNKGQVSVAFKNLETYKLIESTNTKPKEYKLIWTKLMEQMFQVHFVDVKPGVDN